MQPWEIAAWIGGIGGPIALAVQIYNAVTNRRKSHESKANAWIKKWERELRPGGSGGSERPQASPGGRDARAEANEISGCKGQRGLQEDQVDRQPCSLQADRRADGADHASAGDGMR